MARHLCIWDDDWHSTAWASARAVWKRASPEEEAMDTRTWLEAAREDGRFLHVVWCELCQLVEDVQPVPAREPVPATEPGAATEANPATEVGVPTEASPATEPVPASPAPRGRERPRR